MSLSGKARDGVRLFHYLVLARFLDPLNEASWLDEHRSISAFVWWCCLASS